MILLIDNYDSFVHNLARYLQRLGHATKVVRNDAVTPAQVRAIGPQAIVLSPGPCTPRLAGVCLQLVKALGDDTPILGVCLGHQALAQALGGRIVRAPEPMHGRTSEVFHDGRGVFAGLPNPLIASRYHSLVVDPTTLPDCLEVSARTSDGLIMAVRHRTRPLVGMQFHPESILTPCGYQLLSSFLRRADLAVASRSNGFEGELAEPSKQQHLIVPDVPVTF